MSARESEMIVGDMNYQETFCVTFWKSYLVVYPFWQGAFEHNYHVNFQAYIRYPTHYSFLTQMQASPICHAPERIADMILIIPITA